MEATRRLSLTLLVVAPLIVAREIHDIFPYSSVGAEASGRDLMDQLPYQPLDLDDWVVYKEVQGNNPWRRNRRSLDTPGEDMETAEQILFRPIFRHRQLVEERQERDRARDQLRRTSQQVQAVRVSRPQVVDAPRPPNAQKRYFATPLGAVYRAQRSVYPLPYHRQQ